MSNRQPRTEVTSTSASSDSPSPTARSLEPPRYGQAAAIYALYQFGLTPERPKAKPPRKPGGGKLVRALEGALRVLRGPLPVPL